jgi:DNA-directed RNA polymerase specialized sigma24 family protein
MSDVNTICGQLAKPKKPNLAAIKHQMTRTNIEQTYNEYMKDNASHLESLLASVSKFAKSKVSSATFDEAESARTPDDYAQDITIKVWSNLSKCEATTGAGFYAWLNRICFTQSADAFNEAQEESAVRVPLFVEDENGFKDDNPLLNSWDDRPLYRRRLPDFIQGTDLMICNLIRDDKNYKQIGWILQISEAAVKQRVGKMRKRVSEMKPMTT